MLVNNSVTMALVVLIVVILTAGMLMGLSLTETELLNPFTAQATSEDMQRATYRQSRIDEIDLQYYEEERAAETEAQKARIQQEIIFQQQQSQQTLKEQKERHALVMNLLPILLIVACMVLVAIGVSLSIYLTSRARQPQPVITDPWASPEWREQMRNLARAQERLLRSQELQWRVKEPATSDNGHHEPAAQTQREGRWN